MSSTLPVSFLFSVCASDELDLETQRELGRTLALVALPWLWRSSRWLFSVLPGLWGAQAGCARQAELSLHGHSVVTGGCMELQASCQKPNRSSNGAIQLTWCSMCGAQRKDREVREVDVTE
jgi:hypothetical protein